MACTTRETVTRTLGQFRKEGWISIEDSLVTFTSRAAANTLLGIFYTFGAPKGLSAESKSYHRKKGNRDREQASSPEGSRIHGN